MIMPREYKSFEEIDQHLSVLKLQREIDQESLKLHYYRAKVDLAPGKLLRALGTTFTQRGTWKNVLVAFLIKKALRLFQKRRERELLEE